jgi:putative nucleotidyltransferase with HDIG domain
MAYRFRSEEYGKIRRNYPYHLVFFLLSIIAVTASFHHKENESLYIILGNLIMVSSCYLVLYIFLHQFRPEVLEVKRKTLFIFITVFSFILITRIVSDRPEMSIYLIPFTIIPIVIRTFFDARLALFILLITIMLAGFLVPEPFEFVFLTFLSGLVAIFSLTNTYGRAKYLFSSLMVIITYSIIFLGINLLEEENIKNTFQSEFKWFVGNAFLILLSYPVISIFERKFYFLSDSTLMELSDSTQPLLRRLSEEAPGSFQHSLQVANLAEEAARKVGANPLLVRAGALYHDIGKIINPEYFIENLSEGLSPHSNIDSLSSACMIKDHISRGLELARSYKLPVQIIDFIKTHHGTTTAYFFYKKFLDENPQKIEMKNEFMYPGPKPFSKETAIVMMSDAIEASSRSLVNYSEENIRQLVDRIIYLQEMDDQFSGAPLTFKDISDIKDVFIKRLVNIYHARVAYPGRDSNGYQ